MILNNNKTIKIITFYFLQTESNYDFLYIYDGPNEQSTILGKFHGNLGSFEVSSTGNKLFAKFDSNSNVTREGFFAKVVAVCADGFFNFPTCQGKHYLHTFSLIVNIELS